MLYTKYRYSWAWSCWSSVRSKVADDGIVVTMLENVVAALVLGQFFRRLRHRYSNNDSDNAITFAVSLGSPQDGVC